LVKTFFSEIAKLKEEMIQTHGSALFLMRELNLKDIKGMMFHMIIFQGFFGGLVAGKMGEGTIGSGLKHCLILMSIGFIVFVFFML
jgi:flagellar protein FlaJ